MNDKLRQFIDDNFLVIDKNVCFECGEPAEDWHHVVPEIRGGTNVIPLCVKCHGLVHDVDLVRVRALQKVGIEKAKLAGKYKGRVPGSTKTNPQLATKLKEEGKTAQEISDELGISIRTVWRYVGKSNERNEDIKS